MTAAALVLCGVAIGAAAVIALVLGDWKWPG